MTVPNPTILRIDAAGVADAHVLHAPGSLLLSLDEQAAPRVLAVGHPADVDTHAAAADARCLARPEAVVMPGLVNAHAHLDLTAIGPRPSGGSFGAFVDLVRAERPREPAAIAAGVRTGVDLSIRGGVVAVGDIAGCPPAGPTLAPFDALAASGLAGVSFLEFFAIGASLHRGIESMQALAPRAHTGSVRFGLQPHAPYSATGEAYHAAASYDSLPLATHLAETPEEIELIARGSGPFRAFLERLGLWDDSCVRAFGQGLTPVAHVLGALAGKGVLAAHVNSATDGDIALLARTGSCVAYCPRSSAYFHAPERLGAHRYRDMLEAGVSVALGTDSIINLDTPDRISTLDEMRLLFRRDATPAHTLLAMATTHGARALGLDPSAFTLAPGSHPLGVMAVGFNHGLADPLESALRGVEPPEMLIGADSGRLRT